MFLFDEDRYVVKNVKKIKTQTPFYPRKLEAEIFMWKCLSQKENDPLDVIEKVESYLVISYQSLYIIDL